jgi:hypothetical protein
MNDPGSGDGHGDPGSERPLRDDLVHFARRVLRLDEEGRLLEAPADLQTVLGELRRRLFEWEVRRATELRDARESGGGETSARVVREARESEREFRDALPGERPPDDGNGEAE